MGLPSFGTFEMDNANRPSLVTNRISTLSLISPTVMHLRLAQTTRLVAFSTFERIKKSECTLTITSSAASLQSLSQNQVGCYLLDMTTSTATSGIRCVLNAQVFLLATTTE